MFDCVLMSPRVFPVRTSYAHAPLGHGRDVVDVGAEGEVGADLAAVDDAGRRERELRGGSGRAHGGEKEHKQGALHFNGTVTPWLPDGCSRIFRSYVIGPSGFWTMAPPRYAAKFAIWQP